MYTMKFKYMKHEKLGVNIHINTYFIEFIKYFCLSLLKLLGYGTRYNPEIYCRNFTTTKQNLTKISYITSSQAIIIIMYMYHLCCPYHYTSRFR